MTMRELLNELKRIAEMQSMVESLDQSTPSGKSQAGRLLAMSIQRAQQQLQARFSPRQLEAAMRMQQLMSEEAA